MSDFDTFWSVYPKRLGSNPKKPAQQKFERLVKSGVDPNTLVRAAMQMAEQDKRIIGTPFIPMAVTWLNQQRFADMGTVKTFGVAPLDWEAVCLTYRKFKLWSKWAGPDPDSPACRCPADILIKHGLRS